jgi:ABC-type transporter MlaC component
VLIATRPVDFRKEADSLAAMAKEMLAQDPFCGAVPSGLGPHWQNATTQQRQEYVELCENYVVIGYSAYLSALDGQSLKCWGADPMRKAWS